MANKHISHVKSDVIVALTYVNKNDSSDIISAEAYNELPSASQTDYQVNTQGPKLPATDRIEYGELAVNYSKDYERISLKNKNNEIVEFVPKKDVENIASAAAKNASNVFTGATSIADGAAGIVPQPLTSDKDKFLKGDGTWGTVSTGNTTGIKKSQVTGTKKEDATVISADSSTGLSIEGGKNLFKIGDGTNYVEVPITPTEEVLISATAPTAGSEYELFVDTSEDPVIIDAANFMRGSVNVVTVQDNMNNLEPTANGNLVSYEQMHIIYVNGGNADYTLRFVNTYKTPKGTQLELICPQGGYCEVNFWSDGTNIYLRGV